MLEAMIDGADIQMTKDIQMTSQEVQSGNKNSIYTPADMRGRNLSIWGQERPREEVLPELRMIRSSEMGGRITAHAYE